MSDQKAGEKIVIKVEEQLYTGQTVLQGSGIKVNNWSQQYQKTRFFRDMNGVLHPISLNATSAEMATSNWGEKYVQNAVIDFTVTGVKAVVSAYAPGAGSAVGTLAVNTGKVLTNAYVDGVGQYLKGEEITYVKNLGGNFKLSGFKGTEKFNLVSKTGIEKTAAVIANTGYYANMGVRALDNPATLLDKDAFKLGSYRGKFYIGGAQFKDVTINQFSIGKTSEGFVFKNLLLGKYLPNKRPTDDLSELTNGWSPRDWQSFGNLRNAVNPDGSPIYTPLGAVLAINEYQRVHGKPESIDDIGENLYQDALKDASWLGFGAEFQHDYGVTWLNTAVKAWNSSPNFSTPTDALVSIADKTVVPAYNLVTGAGAYVVGGAARIPEFIIKGAGSFMSNIIAPVTKFSDGLRIIDAGQTELNNSRIFVRRNANGQYEIIGEEMSFTGPFGEESLDDRIRRSQTYGNRAGVKITTVDLNKLTYSDVGTDPALWLKELKQRVLDNGLEQIKIGRKYSGLFQTPTTRPEWTNEQTQNVEEDIIVTTEKTKLAEVIINAPSDKSAGTNKKTQFKKDKKGNTWTFKNGVPVSWKDKNGQIWNYDNASKVSYQTEIINGKESRIYPSKGERYRDYQYAIERVDLNAYEQQLRQAKMQKK